MASFLGFDIARTASLGAMWHSLSLYDHPRMMEYLKRVSLKRTPESFTFAFAGRTPSRVQELRDREFAGTIYEAWIHMA